MDSSCSPASYTLFVSNSLFGFERKDRREGKEGKRRTYSYGCSADGGDLLVEGLELGVDRLQIQYGQYVAPCHLPEGNSLRSFAFEKSQKRPDRPREKRTHLKPRLRPPHVPPIRPLRDRYLPLQLACLLRVRFSEGKELGEDGFEDADVGGGVEGCVRERGEGVSRGEVD